MMIQSSQTVDLEKEVIEAIWKVSEISAVIDDLISEEIAASFPVPMGEISICAENRNCVVSVSRKSSTLR
jgi:hypothetical protein